MIFLCFAAKDRYTIAESVLYHLENFGIPVWYDRHDLIIGDHRGDINMTEGILNNQYAILLITHHMEDCVCANEEIELVHSQYDRGEMKVFPIFYKITAEQLPKKYNWLKELIYRETDEKTGTLLTVSSIVCRYLKDKVQKCRNKMIIEYVNDTSYQDKSNYIESLLNTYLDIDHNNLNARMSLLYAAFLYLKSVKSNIPFYCSKPFSLLYSLCKLNLTIDFKELRIMEYALLILLDE